MRTALIDRRVTTQVNPHDLAASAFLTRKAAYSFAQIQLRWRSCPVCQASRLAFPTLAQMHSIPETLGVCRACATPFALAQDGSLRSLQVRSGRDRRSGDLLFNQSAITTTFAV